MSETRFTPGPWTTHRARLPADGEYDWCIAAKESDGATHVIAEAFGRVAEHVRPNASANAHLISAAPDLYAADKKLEAIVTAASMLPPDVRNLICSDEEFSEALRAARAALKKARGES